MVYAQPKADFSTSRFLRARSFQPTAAVAQFKRSEEWRKEIDMDNLYANGVSPEDLEHTRLFYPKWTGRRDKVRGRYKFCALYRPLTFHHQNGLPVYIYPIADLQTRQKELEAVPPKQRSERMCEMALLLLLPVIESVVQHRAL